MTKEEIEGKCVFIPLKELRKKADQYEQADDDNECNRELDDYELGLMKVSMHHNIK